MKRLLLAGLTLLAASTLGAQDSVGHTKTGVAVLTMPQSTKRVRPDSFPVTIIRGRTLTRGDSLAILDAAAAYLKRPMLDLLQLRAQLDTAWVSAYRDAQHGDHKIVRVEWRGGRWVAVDQAPRPGETSDTSINAINLRDSPPDLVLKRPAP